MKLSTILTQIILTTLLVILNTFNSNSQEVNFTLKTDHYAVVVTNMEKSVDFYGRVLGLKEVKNQTGKSNIRWFGLGDGRELHLINMSKEGISLNKNVHLALATDNLDGLMQRLDQLKVPYENWFGEKDTKNDRPDGVLQVYVQDPDGYWLEINDVAR